MPEYNGATPTKTANVEYSYQFDAWTPEISKVTGDITYTATYTATKNKYKVTFIDEDGKTILKEAKEYTYGTEAVNIERPETPTKEATAEYSYEFAGWEPEIKDVTENAIYKATYKEIINKYTVTFVDEDGKTVLKEATEYDYGTKASDIAKPSNPTKKATAEYTYTFAGWEPTIVDVTEDATYKAKYNAVKNKYTVTWKNEDGTELEKDLNVEYGVMPQYNGAIPTKAVTDQYTYTFKGWSPEISKVTGNITYIATYTETINKYTVTFVDEDGKTVLKEATKYDYGTKASDIVKPEEPTKASDEQYSYAFAGWEPTIVDVIGDATYKATYTKTVRKYTVTWLDEDGTELEKDLEVEYGTMPSYDGQTPTKESTTQYSYTFEGWSPKVSKVTGDVRYVATYSKEAVNVTLSKMAVDSNGKEVLPLHEYSEGDTVNYKLTITNNGTKTIKTYTVTDTLVSELSFNGTQPDGTSVNGNTLTWTISDLGAKETKSIIIKTKINSNAWSTRPQSSYNAIDVVNTNKTNKETNCTFYIYNSENGEVPFENGTTQYPGTGKYKEVGKGRVSGEKYNSNLTSIENLNSVIDTHNMIEDVIEYGPEYDPGEGKIVLWYVSKNVYFGSYHVDGVVVDLNDIYAVTNNIKGSSNAIATDTILVKDK